MLASIIRRFSRLLSFISYWCLNLFASCGVTCNLSQILAPNLLILLMKGTHLRVCIIWLIKGGLWPIGFLREPWSGGGCRSTNDISGVSMLMMNIVCIHYFLLSLIRSVLVELHVLEHALPVKLISGLWINVGIYQHLWTWLVLLRRRCRWWISSEVFWCLYLSLA